MMSIWFAWIAVAAGIVGLVWSADRFVAGSAAIAKNLGVSKMVIGLTIVSLGTSAPEILVAINASLSGSGDLAVGNAIGSNIANIGLVLAITALIAALPIQKHLLTQEVPVLLFVTTLAGVFLYDARLVFWEGLLLIVLIVPLLTVMVKVKKSQPSEEETDIPDLSTSPAILWFVIGLVVLIISSKILVSGAETIATHFGVSPLIIGLTVVAVGTSLPELAASVMSAVKGHHDIALGNIVGSNIFNILAVMSVPGLIGNLQLDPAGFYRDYAVMAAITVILCAALIIDYRMKGLRKHGHLGRLVGSILLICYIAYYGLIFATQ